MVPKMSSMLANLSLNIMTGIGGTQLSTVVFWRTLAGIFGALAVQEAARKVSPAG